MSSERKETIALITHACNAGARQAKACNVIGISTKTFQRWAQADNNQDGRVIAKHKPGNKFTEIERQRVVTISNTAEFANLPPSQIVPRLADKGRYIGSE
jgi:putative transposase